MFLFMKKILDSVNPKVVSSGDGESPSLFAWLRTYWNFTIRLCNSTSYDLPDFFDARAVNNIADLGDRQGNSSMERVPSRVMKDFIFGIFKAEPPSFLKGMISFGCSSAKLFEQLGYDYQLPPTAAQVKESLEFNHQLPPFSQHFSQ
nr:hypothetical protein [Tanacetum cinerariifolium]